MQELQTRIEKLEGTQTETSQKIEKVAESASETKESVNWTEKIKFFGDLRLRYDGLGDDKRNDFRNRGRIRFRLGAEAEITDELSAAMRFASGNNENPISRNQTLEDAFGAKEFWIDQAYADYHPHWLEGLNIYGGKMPNPFMRLNKSQLMWDSDLQPEGAALTYNRQMDSFTPFVNSGGFIVTEETDDADVYLLGLQTGVLSKVYNEVKVTGGAGYFDFLRIENTPIFSYGGRQRPNGNTAIDINPDPNVTDLIYANDFNLIEGFGDVTILLRDIPVSLYGDVVVNTAVDRKDLGWLSGIQIGDTKEPQSWQLRYFYRDVDEDATLGIMNDSDFADGITGSRGHTIEATYQITQKIQTKIAYFMAEYLRNNDNLDYDRVQVDFIVKF